MLPKARMAAVARLAAALVAVTLSGAPRVLALHAPEQGHRCSCAAHAGEHHDCECALCHKAALAARASDESTPPCHREAARKELAERVPADRRSAPCLEGTCGRSDPPPLTPAGVEPFCAPSSRPLALAEWTERRSSAAGPVRDRSPEPETPPPRAA